MKSRFIANPFQELELTATDRSELEDLANQRLASSYEIYAKFATTRQPVNTKRWKVCKESDKIKVYSERLETPIEATENEPTGSGLPMLWCIGTMEGKLDDVMFGVMSETLETMRVKASYVEDLSGSALLDVVILPTEEHPFQSLVIKWMEIEIPFGSTFVKNRDCVYLEGTGFFHGVQGERVGYQLLHSISLPQLHELPNRVRSNLSIISFWRQIGNNTIEMYATGLTNPVDSGMIRKFIVSSMTNAFLACLKYASCGQMRKLKFMLDKKYAASKVHGTPNKPHVCVTCSSPVSKRRLGDFGSSEKSCELCFAFVCSACKIIRKLSFVDADLFVSQRKVVFCTVCICEVTHMNATEVARARIRAQNIQLPSFMKSLISDNNTLNDSTINESTSCGS